jgi:hypothetical protein
MFIELWNGVRNLSHDNNQETARENAKAFVNWTLRDLANEYDWGCLRGTLQVTATADDMLLDLTQIHQLTASANTLYIYSDATADGGLVIQAFGKRVNTDNTFDVTSDSVTLIATATATGGVSFSHIDHFRKATTSGSVYIVSAGGDLIATLGPTDTYVSNDVSKINSISDISNTRRVDFIDYATQRKADPGLTYNAQYSGYDIGHENAIQLLNCPSGTVLLISYQRLPRNLVLDHDRTEFPPSLWPGIIDTAYIGWALRFQDEADGTQGKAAYKTKLREIASSFITGKDKKSARVMPSWYKRGL